MLYDCDLKKGIRKKSLPEPNPTKVEVESNSSLLEVQKRAKELYFKKYTTPPEMLLMGDSSGVPILITDTTWTIGTFFQNHSLQPSRYKMYFMLDLKVSHSNTIKRQINLILHCSVLSRKKKNCRMPKTLIMLKMIKRIMKVCIYNSSMYF